MTDQEQLAQLITAAKAEATRVLESEEKAAEWLERPCRALGGYKPIDLLETAEGVQAVLDVLGRIEYGVYS